MDTEKLREFLQFSESVQSLLLICEEDISILLPNILTILIQEEGMNGIFVCIDRPTKFYTNVLTSRKIPPEKLFLIEVSRSPTTPTFVESPSDLTSLKIAITDAINQIPKSDKVFFTIDSIESLSLYNDPKTIGRFLHETNLQMRINGIFQLYILIPDHELCPIVKKLSDRHMEISTTPESIFAKAFRK
ncbi:MAG: hypothetical protein QXP42_04490 [Candidatus Micrarchaeia archaeon]